MKRRNFAKNTLTGMLGLGLVSEAELYGASTSPLVDHVIYLYMDGGMTHLDTFDPKENTDVAGQTKIIETDVPGLRLGHNLPKIASHADKMATINSLNSQTGAHRQGQYLMRTSYTERATIVHPTLGAWAALYDDDKTTLPSYVSVSKPSRHPGSGWMKAKYSPVDIIDPNKGLLYSDLKPEDKRMSLLDEMNRKFKPNSSAVKDYQDFYDEAFRLVQSQDLEVFDLSKEDKAIRDSYGDNKFGQGCLLARRLVESGVKFIEVTHGGWDTHVNNFDAMDTKLPVVDNAVGTLISDLESRGLMDRTLIVFATEFGRTPKINQNVGRDHYPRAFSGAMIGGAINPQAYGKTDETGENVIENAVTVANYNATIAYALGLPLDKVVYSPTERPFYPAGRDAEPITSLFR